MGFLFRNRNRNDGNKKCSNYCDGSRKIFHHEIYPILTYVESTEDTIENNKAK